MTVELLLQLQRSLVKVLREIIPIIDDVCIEKRKA